MPDINLSPYTAESAAIAQRMRMAELLGQQAMQPVEVPQQPGVKFSPYAGLAKMLQGYTSGMMQNKALEQQAALANKYQAGNQADISSFLQARLGSQAKELAGPAPQGAPQGISSEGMEGGYIQPAQAPDVNRAMAIALGSQNPSLQAAGGAMLSQMTAQDKIKDFKVELVGNKTHRIGYTETGKRIDLGPITESVSPDTAARLKQDKEQADRAFSQLSAKDKATLANEAARIGISAQQLFFDTGIKAGGGAFVNPIARPAQPTAPSVAPALTPNAVPVATPPQAYTPLGQLSPKAQQEIEKARVMEGIIPKPLTEAQGNATAFGMRMAESNKLLNALESKGVTNTGLIRQAIVGAVGLTPFVGEKLQSAVKSSMNPLPGVLGGPSSGQQEYDQAKQNFITAVLRKESGAAIGASEFKTEDEKYFPQAGDTDKVIAQKQAARELAIKAMGIQAGPQGARNIAPQGDPLGLR